MQREIQMKVNMIRMNKIPVVSADAVSWRCEVDQYGRNKPVQRAWTLLPAYLAAVPLMLSGCPVDGPSSRFFSSTGVAQFVLMPRHPPPLRSARGVSHSKRWRIDCTRVRTCVSEVFSEGIRVSTCFS